MATIRIEEKKMTIGELKEMAKVISLSKEQSSFVDSLLVLAYQLGKAEHER